jgi:hypothetical protein
MEYFNLGYRAFPAHAGMNRIASRNLSPMATYTARLSCRIFTISASRNRIGCSGYTGRVCQTFTSSMTSEIIDGETSTP